MSSGSGELFQSTQEHSLAKFVERIGQCFYVPAYQRYFVWGSNDVERFYNDMVEGLRRYIAEGEYFTFVGTITGFHDLRYETIEPQVRQDVPDSVINIVDGQQRITTMIIGAVLFHNFIRVTSKQCKSKWLVERIAVNRLDDLARVYEILRRSGSEEHYYPKMIRAFDDVWSVDERLRRYHSPLSHFIHLYSEFSKTRSSENYQHQPQLTTEALSKEQLDAHKKFSDYVQQIDTQLRFYFNNQRNDNSGVLVNNLSTMINHPTVIQIIANQEAWPEEANIDLNDDTTKQLAMALLLSSYFLNKIRFVALIAHNENQSFEVFDSLNTTGQTLTAIETFKPFVMQDIGIANYKTSEEKRIFDKIDSYIGALNTPEKQKKAASEIVIGFALAENGYSLETSLGAQREYLHKNYKKLGQFSGNEKIAFLRQLFCFAQVHQYFWNDVDNWDKLLDTELPIEKELLDEAQFCLTYLKASNHRIALPLLARFVYNMRYSLDTSADALLNSTVELLNVICATAGFFGIWRSTRATTDNIDDWHSELHRLGISKIEDDNPCMLCMPTCRRAKLIEPLEFCADSVQVQGEVISSNNGKEKFTRPALSANNIKQAFKYIIKSNNKGSKLTIKNKDAYITEAHQVPIYRTQRTTAKLLILLAAHNSVPSTKIPGHFDTGRPGILNLLKRDEWKHPNYASIDHIIPQSEANNDHVKSEILHRIGNLILLSRKANSFLRNLPWQRRKLYYEMISAESEEQILLIKAANEDQLKNSERFVDYLVSTEASSMLKALAGLEEFDWDSIEPRGKHLAGRAWDIMYDKWLSVNLPD